MKTVKMKYLYKILISLIKFKSCKKSLMKKIKIMKNIKQHLIFMNKKLLNLKKCKKKSTKN